VFPDEVVRAAIAQGREVLVFATPPATDLIKAHGIDCIVAQENVAEFVENLFGALYRMKALLYPRTIRPRFDQMREICGLPTDAYTDGSTFKVWPHDLPGTWEWWARPSRRRRRLRRESWT